MIQTVGYGPSRHQLRAVVTPFLKVAAPPELAAKLVDILRDLEDAINEIKLF